MNAPMASSSLEAAVTALGAWDLETAERLLKGCIASKVQLTEAHYYLGILEILRMNESRANDYFAAYQKLPLLGGEFYPLFGKLMAALGSQGETLLTVVKRTRLFPRQVAMKMSGEQIDQLVEPWHYSASNVHLFPRKQSE
jgi:hypothetical protein